MFKRIYVGLDVHAENVVACAVDTATGGVIRDRMAADPVAVAAWLQRFDPGSLQVVYEAGPTVRNL